MDAKEIYQHWKREPFVPFRLELDDGTRHYVRRPGDMRLFVGRVYLGLDDGVETNNLVDVDASRVSDVTPLPDLLSPGEYARPSPEVPKQAVRLNSEAMTSRQIAEKLDALPFKPLRFQLSDGMSYDVNRGSAVMMLDGQLVIGLDPDSDGIPRRSAYVDPHHVTRVETLTPSNAAKGQQNAP